MKVSRCVVLTLGVLISVASGCSDPFEPTTVGEGPYPPPPVAPTPPVPGYPAPSTSWHIFLTSPSGGAQQQLARGFSPVWSPDGSKLAFGQNLRGRAAIYVTNADGSGQRQLTESNGHSGFPRWSPDGSKIAFMSRSPGYFFACQWDVSDCYGEISVINADGTGETQLVSDAFLAGWSPDGKKIAFVSGQAVYTINPDGTNLTKLTQLAGVSGADWSPDGRRIALRSGGAVYVMNADGSGLKQLTNDALVVYSVMWSPQGDRIAFNLGLPVGPWEFHIDLKSFRIEVINQDGTNRISLAADALDPHWSPDGRSLSFVRLYDKGLRIVPADGGEPSVSLPDEYVDKAMWSPDGNRIAYAKWLDN